MIVAFWDPGLELWDTQNYRLYMSIVATFNLVAALSVIVGWMYFIPRIKKARKKHEELLDDLGELLPIIKEWVKIGGQAHKDAEGVLDHIKKGDVEPAKVLAKEVIKKTDELKEVVENVPKKVVDEIKRDGSTSSSGEYPTVKEGNS